MSVENDWEPDMSVPFPGSPDDMMNTIAALRARVAQLEAALPIVEQMLLEVEAAIHRGPSWYTRGERGMADQVLLHVQRARAALKDEPQ